jgi:hypothetical protein
MKTLRAKWWVLGLGRTSYYQLLASVFEAGRSGRLEIHMIEKILASFLHSNVEKLLAHRKPKGLWNVGMVRFWSFSLTKIGLLADSKVTSLAFFFSLKILVTHCLIGA